MPITYLTPKAQPCGTTLARLSDVPLAKRQAALHKLMAQGLVSAEESEALLDLVIDPGDHSTRVAA